MDNWFKSSDDQNQPRVEDRPGLRFSRSRPYTRKKVSHNRSKFTSDSRLYCFDVLRPCIL